MAKVGDKGIIELNDYEYEFTVRKVISPIELMIGLEHTAEGYAYPVRLVEGVWTFLNQPNADLIFENDELNYAGFHERIAKASIDEIKEQCFMTNETMAICSQNELILNRLCTDYCSV